MLATRYRIVRELGRGGMGTVFLVEHVHTGQHLALKVLSIAASLSSSSIERFKREARAPARIRSENVVTVTDADVLPELGGMPFLVMELLNGRDLEAEVAIRGRLPASEVVEMLGQAVRALGRSHALGIIHRDLKPENLFLHRRDDGTTSLKILDFGISKTLEDEGGAKAASLTGPGSLIGTPLYMSPEQATEGTAITLATDVWSLGLVAVRLLTGEHYWRATTVPALMAQLLRDPLYAPSSRWPWLPPAFDVWFARSCDRDPERRYPSVGLQIDELARAFGEAAPPRVPIGSNEPDEITSEDAIGRMQMAPTLRHDSSKATLAESGPTTTPRSRAKAFSVLASFAAIAAIGIVSIVPLRTRRSTGGAGLVATGQPPASALESPAPESPSSSAPRLPAPSVSAPVPVPPPSTHPPPRSSPITPAKTRPRKVPSESPTHDPVAP